MATATATRTTRSSAKTQEKSDFGERSIVGDFAWKDVLIPDNVGKGAAKWYYQRRTLVQYAIVAGAGLYAFYTFESPSIRASSLGLLFPGAGLVAVATIPSIFAFVISTLLIPLVMFAWFGAGGILFPIVLWVGSSALAGFLARDSLFDIAGPVWTAICVGGIGYMTYSTHSANAAARAHRQKRNEYLIKSVQEAQAAGKEIEPGSRELDLRTLRFVQWHLELAHSPKDDFSYHDVIDQFQTSAIRYQLYESVSDLGCYQFIYAPNFHGYLSQGMRNCIEKSLTERVVGFWKWESLWGKFTTMWDPIVKDNIMVSGYVLQAVGIYQSNTGDDRYTKPGSLTFEIDKNHKYPYDLKGIADAVNRNWEEGPYCLYSCEPNWIYTPCNLVGISGMLYAERLLGVNYASKLKKRFEKALEEEFSTQDGSVLPIRSELTGFTIPGLAGKLSDAINSILCASYLPHIAHRNWSFTKNEAIRKRADGRVELVNLVGADKMDPGNYKPGEGNMRALFAAAAAEFGDVELRDEMLRQLDEEFHPTFATATGSMKNKGLSVIWQGNATRARMGAFQDWVKMANQGPPVNVRNGPILDEVAFPDVLVAKAYSQDGVSLDLVLYPGKDAGVFSLGFKNLRPGETYDLGAKSATAKANGTASFEAHIDGRTALKLVPRQLN